MKDSHCGLVFSPSSDFASLKEAWGGKHIVGPAPGAPSPPPQNSPQNSSQNSSQKETPRNSQNEVPQDPPHNAFSAHQQLLVDVKREGAALCLSNSGTSQVSLMTGLNGIAEIHTYQCSTKDLKSVSIDSCTYAALGPEACGFQWHQLPTSLNSDGGYNSLSLGEYATTDGKFNVPKWCSDQMAALKNNNSPQKEITSLQNGIDAYNKCIGT